ncbi:MAG: YgfZ/GcvT domain-containing protein [Acidobacteriota bacterium]
MTGSTCQQLSIDRRGRLVEIDGFEATADYGDELGEYEAARSSVALMHRTWRALIKVNGEARASFLQRLLTNDIEAVDPGEGCRALLLDQKGKVVGDLDLWVGEESIHISCDAGVADVVLAELHKRILRAPVEFEDLRDQKTVVGVVGPSTGELLESAGIAMPSGSMRAHLDARIADNDVRIARTPALAAIGVEVHLSVACLRSLYLALEKAGGGPPALLGWNVAEILRVEEGLPRHGRELTGEQLPQEARMEDGVDFEKGCYLGQETVARLHYRGHVNRRLVGLRLSEPVLPGAELMAAERNIGKLTSAVISPCHGPIGLGFVRRQQTAPGTRVMMVVDGQGAGEATVASLPFKEKGG